MDIEMNVEGKSHGVSLEGIGHDQRPRNSLRLLYQAEVRVFRAQHGGLEEIRQKLGFSRRKMCQLLLVDPSAWTRWCKDEDRVPPHIYRALEWFLALNQKALTQPDLASVFLSRHKLSPAVHGEGFRDEIGTLKAELRWQRRISLALGGAILALALVILAL